MGKKRSGWVSASIVALLTALATPFGSLGVLPAVAETVSDPTPTPESSNVATISATPTPTPTLTASPTASPSPTASASATPSSTASATSSPAPTATYSSAPISAQAVTAPVNTADPVVTISAAPAGTSGKPKIGSTLSVSNGSWTMPTGSTASYQFRWYRCDTLVSTATAILPSDCVAANTQSATRTYVTVAADADKYMVATVIAKATVGTEFSTASETSASTQPVVKPVSNIAPPVLRADAKAEFLETLEPGGWSGSSLSPASYKWYVCTSEVTAASNTKPASCTTEIAAETSSTYTPTRAQAGKWLVVAETVSNDAGAATKYSRSSRAVMKGPIFAQDPVLGAFNATTSVPVAKVGSIVKITNAATMLDSFPAPTVDYFWYTCDERSSTATDSLPANCVQNSTSTTPQITTTADMVGKYVLALISAGNEVWSTSKFSATTTAAVASVPTAGDTAPTLSGTPTVGEVLTANDGTWNGTPTPTISREWYRCSSRVTSAGSNTPPTASGCTRITNQTDQTYALVAADAQKFILVRIIATNSVGTASRYTASTAYVSQIPANTLAPVVSGSAYVGNTLSATAGNWTGYATPTLTYQWYLCGSQISTATSVDPLCMTAPGASTAASYQLPLDALNSWVTVGVTATNGGGSVTTWSSTSPQVGQKPTINVEPYWTISAANPRVDENQPLVNSVLTATAGQWLATPAISARSWQWYSCTAVHNTTSVTKPTDCTEIAGAITSTLGSLAAYKGKYILVAEKAVNLGGFGTSFSTSTKMVVAPAAVTYSGSFTQTFAGTTASGSPKVGGTATLGGDAWTGTSLPTMSFQWARCVAAQTNANNLDQSLPAGCTFIGGATERSYNIGREAAGQYLIARSIGTNEAGTVISKWSTSTTKFVTLLPEPSSIATVSGDYFVGAKVTATAGSFVAFPPLTATGYQWYRCDNALTDQVTTTPVGCSLISGATASSYTLVAADNKKYLSVAVKATNEVGTTTAWNPVTTMVQPGPVNKALPTVKAVNPDANLATVVGGNGVTVNSVGTWLGDPAPVHSYQWFLCDNKVASGGATLPANCSAIADATNQNYTVDEAYVGKYLVARVTGTNTWGEASVYSASTDIVSSVPVLTGEAPAASGNPFVGSSLTAMNGGWDSTPAATFTYEWFRCDAPQANPATTTPDGCVSVGTGTTNAQTKVNTYPLVDADGSKYMLVKVRATNPAGFSQVFSASTEKVKAGPVNRVAPNVTAQDGAPDSALLAGQLHPVVGKSVSTDGGTWSGNPVPELSYQWYLCTSAVSQASATAANGCTVIDGAQTALIPVTPDFVSKYLLVRVTGTNSIDGSDYTGTKFSASSFQVTQTPEFVSTEAITGVPYVKGSVSAGTATFSGSPTPALSYQWYRCTEQVVEPASTQPTSCDLIEGDGAKGRSFTLTASDLGAYLSARVAAVNVAGSAIVWQPSTSQVTTGAVSTAAPATSVTNPVTGATPPTPKVGGGVSATTGTWEGSPAPTTSTKWLACDAKRTVAVSSVAEANPQGCEEITDATGTSIATLTHAQAGKYLVLKVAGTNSAGTSYTWSASTEQVNEAPSFTEPPSLSGSTNITKRLTVLPGAGNGVPLTITQEWYRCTATHAAVVGSTAKPSDCARITSLNADATSYVLSSPIDTSKYLMVKVIKTNKLGTASYWSATTTKVTDPPRVLLAPTMKVTRGTVGTKAAADPIEIGDTLSFTGGTFAGTPTPTTSYQWYSCSEPVTETPTTVPTACVAIPDARSASFAPQAAQQGTFMLVELKGSGEAADTPVYSYTKTSPQLIVAPRYAANKAPTVTGERLQNSTLTVDVGEWTGFPVPTQTVQWYRCTNPVADPPETFSASQTALPTGCVAIADQLGLTYTVTTFDVDKYLTARVTSVNGLTTYTFAGSGAKIAPAPVAPVNTTAPALKSEIRAGGELSFGGNTWTGLPTPTLTQQWYRCDVRVLYSSDTAPLDTNNCVAIDGAIADTYVIGTSDVGKYLLVKTTASNTAGTVSKYSASTQNTIVDALHYTVAPAIGYGADMLVGMNVTVNPGEWSGGKSYSDPAEPYIIDYSWYRCAVATAPKQGIGKPGTGNECLPVITNSSVPSYTLAREDAGKFIAVSVHVKDASNPAVERYYKPASSPQVNASPWNITAPSVTVNAGTGTTLGNPKIGSTLKVNKGTWGGFPAPTYTYKWAWCPDASKPTSASATLPASCQELFGYTDDTLVLPATFTYGSTSYAVAGNAVLVMVSASNTPGGTESLWTPATSKILSAPANTTQPTVTVGPIAGKPAVGSTFTSGVGSWSGVLAPSTSTAWLRCTSEITGTNVSRPTGCSEIPTAVGATYLSTDDDAGKYIVAEVTAINEAGSTKAWSESSSQVQQRVASISAPTLTLTDAATDGSPKVGGKVTTSDGTWKGVPDPTFTYSWYLCDTTLSASCVLIDGQSGSSIDIIEAYASKRLRSKVTARNTVYTVSFTADAVSAISAEISLAPKRLSPPELSTNLPVVGTAMTATYAGATYWKAVPSETSSVRWFACTNAADPGDSMPADCEDTGVTTASFTPTHDYAGKRLMVKSTATNTAGTTSTHSQTTLPVGEAPLAKSPLPTMTVVGGGLEVKGSSLTVSNGTWWAYPTATYSYDWLRCNNPQSETAITGAIPSGCFVQSELSNTYLTSNNDVGKHIAVIVTATNTSGSSKRMTATKQVLLAPEFTTAPTIALDGGALVTKSGGSITATNGQTAGVATPVHSGQWMSCDAPQDTPSDTLPAGCSAISSATLLTLNPIPDSTVGKYLIYRDTATNAAGTKILWSASSSQVLRAPANTVAPTLTVSNGATSTTPQVGGTVTVNDGTWTGSPEPTASYAWYACTSAVTRPSSTAPAVASGCALLADQNGATLSITLDHFNKFIMAKVTATNAAGSAQIFTATTTNKVVSAPASTSDISVTGTPKLGQSLTANRATWVGSATLSKTLGWYACDAEVTSIHTEIPQGCVKFGGSASPQLLAAAQLGKYISALETVSNTYGTKMLFSASTRAVVE